VKAWPLLLLPLAASLFGVWDVLRTERRAMELVEETHEPTEGEDA
jgi:hypothetical protein